jgi:DNA polymerase III subunit delta'
MRFSDILGQERALGFLRQVMASEKMPHAYLFTGIPGVGKKSTAQALAMALNCVSPGDGDACGSCPSCRKIVGGNEPDFQVIRPDGNKIGIDQIRELNRGLSFAPLSARLRVIVICRSEAMTPEAANAFLKTLEEPPPDNIFILTATEPLDLLPTVVSRCQRISFQPLSTAAVAGLISEKEGLSGGDADIIAGLSGGSLGRALAMAESDFLENREKWLARIAKLPSFSRAKALGAAFTWAEDLRTSDARSGPGKILGLAAVLDIWKSWYRDLLVSKAEDRENAFMNRDFSQNLKKISKRFTIKSLARSFHLIDRAQMELMENRNSALVLEHLVSRLRGLVDSSEFLPLRNDSR